MASGVFSGMDRVYFTQAVTARGRHPAPPRGGNTSPAVRDARNAPGAIDTLSDAKPEPYSMPRYGVQGFCAGDHCF